MPMEIEMNEAIDDVLWHIERFGTPVCIVLGAASFHWGYPTVALVLAGVGLVVHELSWLNAVDPDDDLPTPQ
jgi:hypothetical protein